MEKKIYDRFFSEVYEKQGERIICFIARLVKDRDTACDLAQDVFLSAYDVLDSNKGISSDKLKNFLFTCARNRTIDYVRRKQHEKRNTSTYPIENVVVNDTFYHDIEDCEVGGKIISTINDTLSTYPRKTRQVIIESFVNRKKKTEISRQLSVSTYEIRKIERDVRIALKREIAEIIYSRGLTNDMILPIFE